MIDLSTDFGARVERHLREDVVVWLTTVGASGAPLPTVVWFAWDGDRTVRIHSLPSAARVRHLAANPRVSLHFDGDGGGGDIVVFSARASLGDAAPADHEAAYRAKYGEQMTRIGYTPEQFAARYSTLVTLELARLRGH